MVANAAHHKGYSAARLGRSSTTRRAARALLAPPVEATKRNITHAPLGGRREVGSVALSADQGSGTVIVDALAARGLAVHQRPDGQWLAQCPAHQDRSPSLSVAPDGRIHCFAGCNPAAVLDTLGLGRPTIRRRSASPKPRREAPTPPATPAQADREAVAAWVARCTEQLASHEEARAYVRQRWPGITAEDVEALRLGVDPGAPLPERPSCLGGLAAGPRLIVPLLDPDGHVVGCQGRAISTRAKVRWAGPTGAGWSPVGAWGLDREPGPVLVTEGPTDAIAAYRAGMAVIAVVGASRARQAARIIARWRAGRPVVVAGDADEAGRKFADQLAAELGAGRLALPDGVGDLAEWAAEHPDEFPGELQAAVTEATPPPVPAPAETAPARLAVVEQLRPGAGVRRREGEWEAASDGLWRLSDDPEVPRKRLSTCDIEVVEVVSIDDGAETQVAYRTAVRYGGHERVIAVSPAEMDRPTQWISGAGLAGATVLPGCGQAVVAASQILSSGAPSRTVYGQLGWRRIAGELAYLHAGGAIGADGPIEGVAVEMAAPLDGFALPEPPTGERLADDVARALRLVDIGDDAVTIPLLAAVWRAPLGDPGWSVALVGRTGSRKSTIAALAQSFWCPGARYDSLPTSFTATANSIAEQQFRAADALLVVDEYVPAAGDEARSQSAADRVLRGAANHAGRGRLRPDGTPRPVRPPRCLTVVTGEAMPDGESLRARLLSVEMGAGSLPLGPGLDDAQRAAAAGTFARATAAWVQHLAQVDPAAVRATWGHPSTPVTGHPRVDAMLHEVVCTWESVLEWGVDVGALTEAGAAELLARVLAAVQRLGAAQRRSLADATPWRRYLELLRSALSTGRARLAPAAAEAEPAGDPPVIGWAARDGTEVWLEPQASLAVARRLAQDTGRPLPSSLRALSDELTAAGVLVDAEPGHATVRRMVCGRRVRVFVVSGGVLGGADDDAGSAG